MRHPARTAKISIGELRDSWLRELAETLIPSTFNAREVKKRIAEHIRRCSLAENNFPTRSMFLLFDNTTLDYLFVSRSCCLVLGYTSEEFKNMGYKESLLSLCSNEELEYKKKVMSDVFGFFSTHHHDMLLNSSIKYDWVVSRKDGEEIHILEEMWFPEVNEKGEPIIATCFLHDLSEHSDIRNSGIRKCTIYREGHDVLAPYSSQSRSHEKIFSRSYLVQGVRKSPLSAREMHVLELLSSGLTTTKVAARLFLTENTIKTHRKNILLKLDVQNTSEAVRLSLKKNWFS